MLERLYEIYENSSGISTDTRDIKPGSIFFALKGANYNGNEFAEQAVEKGCICAVVDEDVSKNVKVIKVENVLLTLQGLAKLHRSKINIPVIGLTGSNGKTTTKELIRTVLETTYNVLSTKGNLNNHIGVPLTILSIRRRHEIAVIEMGANHPGEIAELCQIADPDLGIITNIGKAHLEGFGDFDGVIKTKNELYQYVMSKHGKIIFDNDNPILVDLIGSYSEIMTYGTKAADITASYEGSDPYIKFSWKPEGVEKESIQTKLIGKYNLPNVLAAITVGVHYKVETVKISAAIMEYEPKNNRSEVVTGVNTLILDAYNANPTSLSAALYNFSEMSGDKFFVLGDMYELGDHSIDEHKAIINLLKTLNLEEGILVGRIFSGLDTDHRTFETVKDAGKYLKRRNLKNKLILVKGSRGVKLEELKSTLS